MNLLSALLMGLGAIAVVVGIGLVYVPAGVIAGGLAAAALGYLQLDVPTDGEGGK